MAAKMASTMRIPPTSTTLSCEPKALIAKFLTGGGVKSIDSCPTATTGELSELISPATSWAMPRARPPARIPAMAPRTILPVR